MPPKRFFFTLDTTILEIVQTHKYLGITLTSRYVTNVFRAHFQRTLQKAKTKAAAARCHVFGTPGFRIKSSVKLYKLQVRPLLEFGAQSLSFSLYSQPAHPDAVGCFAKRLEHLQTQVLKSLIHCPRATCPAIVRLFSGTEPLECRLEILKLRYFWKMLNGSANDLCSSILKYRRDRFLDFDKGFAHDVFTICAKYNIMHIWNGLAPQNGLHSNLNFAPLRYIKRVIVARNLRLDLEAGRSRNCTFSNIYLLDPFSYQEKYHIVEPCGNADCFSSPPARRHFIKALLHPCSYPQNCPFCSEQTSDICDHFLTTCPRLPDPRKKLHLKLTLYNYPANHFPLTKASAILLSLTNRVWRKCFADFLNEVDF